MEEFISIIKTILLSLLTTWIAVSLALRRFYNEKWWEKKLQVYTEILDHLSKLNYIYGEWLNKEELGHQFTEEKKKALSKGSQDSIKALKKISATGSFIISDNAADSLNRLVEEIDKDYLSLYDEIDSHAHATNVCLDEIREFAKKDLKKRGLFEFNNPFKRWSK